MNPAAMLRQAERLARDPEGAGDLLSRLDIGGDVPPVRGFGSPEEVADWFRWDRPEDWRQRD